jgi:hypothetical protein
MSLLLLFRRGYGDWPESPTVVVVTTLKPRHRTLRVRAQAAPSHERLARTDKNS